MKKLICNSYKKEIINEKGSVKFKCPECGQAEIIRDGKNGFVVKPNDYNQMATHISILLRDAALRNRIGKESFRIVKEFDIDKTIGRTLASYY